MLYLCDIYHRLLYLMHLVQLSISVIVTIKLCGKYGNLVQLVSLRCNLHVDHQNAHHVNQQIDPPIPPVNPQVNPPTPPANRQHGLVRHSLHRSLRHVLLPSLLVDPPPSRKVIRYPNNIPYDTLH